MQHFWIVGTDTDVGKTFVTTTMLRQVQALGYDAVPYKPVQTGEIERDGRKTYYDTAMYQQYSLQPLDETKMNGYAYKVPASPHYAAQLESKVIDEQVILSQLASLQQQHDVVICEGAGGLFVPLKTDSTYCLIDLIKATKLPVILVAKTGLGTINHTLLSVEALHHRGIVIKGIVYNGNEGSEMETNNIETMIAHTQLPYAVLPKVAEEQALTNLNFEQTTLLEALQK
ncbi:MAG TPA: dethiobiotin synthase [Metalysinibacillus jejuensis]|uniref:ATP-dependent dethiobiotin synthetase BioD n=1 Tax=Metalysinibacillus jejuensis TaxID=914327 RepID=A0A921NCQ5_9BACL|nr:dethiobiotin synthase [Metalysinibacillus jejuensis]